MDELTWSIPNKLLMPPFKCRFGYCQIPAQALHFGLLRSGGTCVTQLGVTKGKHLPQNWGRHPKKHNLLPALHTLARGFCLSRINSAPQVSSENQIKLERQIRCQKTGFLNIKHCFAIHIFLHVDFLPQHKDKRTWEFIFSSLCKSPNQSECGVSCAVLLQERRTRLRNSSLEVSQ